MSKSPLFRVVAAQFVAMILASASCLLVDMVAVKSALLGGLVCIVPGLYSLAVSRRPVGADSTGLYLAIRGELGRFLLMAAGFALIFVFVKPLNAVAFFGTVVLLQIVMAVVPVLEAKRLLSYPVRQS